MNLAVVTIEGLNVERTDLDRPSEKEEHTMTSNGDWFEAMTESFPGRTPRVLLSWIYWSIVAIAMVVAGFNTWAAFQLSSGSGFWVLAISVVMMMVWLAVWRVMLEAAASLFDIRDSMGQVHQGLKTINQTLKLMDIGSPGGNDARTDHESRPSGSSSGSGSVRGKQTSIFGDRILRYLETSDGANFETISEALDVSQKATVDALRMLAANAQVNRHFGGVWRHKDWQPDSADAPIGAIDEREEPASVGSESEGPEHSGGRVSDSMVKPISLKEVSLDSEPIRPAAKAPIVATPETVPGEPIPHCGACGASHDVGQRFCSRCGSQL